MWTEVQFVEDDDQDPAATEDGFTAVHLFIRECDHHTLPLETTELGTWRQVHNEFAVDFPRLTLYLDGVVMDNTEDCVAALRRRVGETRMRQLVGLCTQGALSQAYAALCQLHPPPAHVLSAGGSHARAHRVHIWLGDGDAAAAAHVQHTRRFVLAHIDCHGNLEEDHKIDMELQLRPHDESLLAIARRVSS